MIKMRFKHTRTDVTESDDLVEILLAFYQRSI